MAHHRQKIALGLAAGFRSLLSGQQFELGFLAISDVDEGGKTQTIGKVLAANVKRAAIGHAPLNLNRPGFVCPLHSVCNQVRHFARPVDALFGMVAKGFNH